MKEAEVLGVLYFVWPIKKTKYFAHYPNFLFYKDKAYKRSDIQTR